MHGGTSLPADWSSTGCSQVAKKPPPLGGMVAAALAITGLKRAVQAPVLILQGTSAGADLVVHTRLPMFYQEKRRRPPDRDHPTPHSPEKEPET